MKKLSTALFSVLLILLLLGFSGCGQTAETSSVPKEAVGTETAPATTQADDPVPAVPTEDIIVLFTNDVHCGIADDIGYSGLAAYKKHLEETHGYVTLVDCGDHVQGGYAGTVSKGKNIISIMNKVGYSLAVLGNHEFDYGMEQLAANLGEARAQYLCCDIEHIGEGKNALEAVKPYVVFSYGGVKVGFVGVSTPTEVPTHFTADGETEYRFISDPHGGAFYACVQENINACRAEGAAYVILLTHLGTDEVDAPFTSRDLIANTTGADAVLDGHSHTEMPCETVTDAEGRTVLLSSTGEKLNNIGQLVISPSGFLSVGYIESYDKKDPDTETYLRGLESDFEAQLNRVIGISNTALFCHDENGVRTVRSRETTVGDFVADAFRTIGNADIGLCNGAGIRSDLAKGNITYRDLITLLPYGDMLCVVKVTGAEIADMLEYFYSKVEKEYVKDGKAIGEFSSFMQVSGIRFAVDVDAATSVEVEEDTLISVGKNRRVFSIQVLNENGEYKPLEADRVYTVATSDHIAKNGGSGMGKLLAGHELVMDCTIPDYQVLEEYVKRLNGNLSGYASPDKRIVIWSQQ